MRFARGDVRDHIVSPKNDHGPLYRPYRALKRQRRQKINFREIFGIVRFSTFSTLSARSGRRRRVTGLSAFAAKADIEHSRANVCPDPRQTSASLCRRLPLN